MSPKRALIPFVLLAVLAGCAAEDCKSGPCSPDERLVETVKAEFAKHPALLADHLRIQSDNGTVYIYGLVSTNVELVEVEEVAKATPGVRKVVNMCAIENVLR